MQTKADLREIADAVNNKAALLQQTRDVADANRQQRYREQHAVSIVKDLPAKMAAEAATGAMELIIEDYAGRGSIRDMWKLQIECRKLLPGFVWNVDEYHESSEMPEMASLCVCWGE